jgi:hypothetical protein
MGSKNPFKAYQKAVVADREAKLATALKELKVARAAFPYITDLAKVVAARITQLESAPCSYTTLLRSSRYKAMLLEFMAAKAAHNPVRTTDPLIQARIRTLELDRGNLERENERLRSFIKDIETSRREVPFVLAMPAKEIEKSELITLSNERAMICKALWLMLEHFRGVVSVDAERGCIIDLAAPQRKNVIVDAVVAKGFLDWLNENAWVGS